MFIQMSNEQFMKEYSGTKINIIQSKPPTPNQPVSPNNRGKYVTPMKGQEKGFGMQFNTFRN
jgi:signal recognition particle subunit SEC65